jgi:cytoskeleton protein RodZ
MSTETEQQEQVVTEETSQVLVGDLLREQREKQGMTQQEVADRLRLRLSIIKSIDENNLEFDQVATFTRGYLRSYAKAVSLDEKVLMQALDGAEEAQHAPQAMQSFSRKTKRDRHDRRIMKLSWVIFVAIFGISAVWWYQNQQDTLEEASQQDAAQLEMSEPVAGVAQPLQLGDESVTEEVQPEPVAVDEPVVQETEEVTTSATEETAAPELVVEDVTPEPVAQPLVVAEPPAPQPVTAGGLLVMNFAADCWVQVKDASGKTLVTGVKKAGQNLQVQGQTPYSVVLGAPEGVKMTFASEPVDLSGYTSGKVARFTLP